jgi:hypothetical protein
VGGDRAGLFRIKGDLIMYAWLKSHLIVCGMMIQNF